MKRAGGGSREKGENQSRGKPTLILTHFEKKIRKIWHTSLYQEFHHAVKSETKTDGEDWENIHLFWFLQRRTNTLTKICHIISTAPCI